MTLYSMSMALFVRGPTFFCMKVRSLHYHYHVPVRIQYSSVRYCVSASDLVRARFSAAKDLDLKDRSPVFNSVSFHGERQTNHIDLFRSTLLRRNIVVVSHALITIPCDPRFGWKLCLRLFFSSGASEFEHLSSTSSEQRQAAVKNDLSWWCHEASVQQ